LSMVFVRGIDNYCREGGRGTVVTVGTFDGMHRGHQEILRRVQGESHRLGLEPVLVTFDPHPRMVVTPDEAPLLLTTIEEKERFIPCFFSGRVVVLHFDNHVQNLSAEEFVKSILVDRIGVRKLVVGYDHVVGKNRSGNIEELTRLGASYGFDLEVVGPILYDGEPVSSSRIRRALTGNRLRDAIALLGHDYAIYGTVERGIGLGRKLGYPTANVRFDPCKLLPVEGVYVCWAHVGTGERDGMMFVGRNHFNPARKVTVEANLFDFDRDIYDEGIAVCPTHFVRPNQKFEDTESLRAQIKSDKENILNIIEREKDHVDLKRAKS
jgi:riboflavin kinase/FMN adenylyltransferase